MTSAGENVRACWRGTRAQEGRRAEQLGFRKKDPCCEFQTKSFFPVRKKKPGQLKQRRQQHKTEITTQLLSPTIYPRPPKRLLNLHPPVLCCTGQSIISSTTLSCWWAPIPTTRPRPHEITHGASSTEQSLAFQGIAIGNSDITLGPKRGVAHNRGGVVVAHEARGGGSDGSMKACSGSRLVSTN